jgi:hypothetical protein
MKTYTSWKQFLFAGLVIILIAGCAPAVSKEPTPEPTPTIKPTITPLPYIEGAEFPTGVFEHVDGYWIGEFREDGSAFWYNTRSPGDFTTTYGVNGNLWSEMKFSYPTGRQVPATYFWHYDGEILYFQVWGVDYRSERAGYFNEGEWRFIEEVEATSIDNQVEFPTGRFINEAGLWTFDFTKDGTWHLFEGNLEQPLRSGKYVTNGEYYTEMTHDATDLLQAPATYIWTYDDQNLSFELWGEDVNDERMSVYDGQTYTKVDE